MQFVPVCPPGPCVGWFVCFFFFFFLLLFFLLLDMAALLTRRRSCQACHCRRGSLGHPDSKKITFRLEKYDPYKVHDTIKPQLPFALWVQDTLRLWREVVADTPGLYSAYENLWQCCTQNVGLASRIGQKCWNYCLWYIPSEDVHMEDYMGYSLT